jgi:hypothetical protein
MSMVMSRSPLKAPQTTAPVSKFHRKSDVSTDPPVEKHELTVDRKGRPEPSVGDALLQLRDERDVTLRV